MRRRRAPRQQTPVVYVPPVPFAGPSATPGYQRSIDSMTAAEARDYFASLYDRVEAMKAAQASYLQRRAARGTNTPTDVMYREFQKLEEELLHLLLQLRDEAERNI